MTRDDWNAYMRVWRKTHPMTPEQLEKQRIRVKRYRANRSEERKALDRVRMAAYMRNWRKGILVTESGWTA